MRARSISPEIEAALRDVLAQKDAIAKLDARKSARDEETQKIFDNQQRLRENIKALRGTRTLPPAGLKTSGTPERMKAMMDRIGMKQVAVPDSLRTR